MAVIGWPQDLRPEPCIICTICHQIVSPHEAAAGLIARDGSQAFACNRHFLSGNYIVGWADFVAQEYGPLQQLMDNNSDEWSSVR